MLFACDEAPGLWFVDFALPFDCGFIVGFGFIAQYVVFELGVSLLYGLF